MPCDQYPVVSLVRPKQNTADFVYDSTSGNRMPPADTVDEYKFILVQTYMGVTNCT